MSHPTNQRLNQAARVPHADTRTEARSLEGSEIAPSALSDAEHREATGGSQAVVIPIPPLPSDPQRIAEAALPFARMVADRTGATISLVSVVDSPTMFNLLTRALAAPAKMVEAQLVAETQARLSRLASEFPSSRVDTVVRVGGVVAEILAVIGEHERPLLVLSSHTRAGLDRLLFGSIAFELVRTAPCPVLVVRGARLGAPSSASLAKVVVPLDQSPFAEHALDTALIALGPPDLRLHLLHIVEPLPHATMAPSELVAMVEPKVQRHLQEIADPLLTGGYRVTTEVRHGKPDEEIAQVAVEQDAGLILMAPHDQGRFHRGLLGSVVEHVLRASPVPLLLVRPMHTRLTAGAGEEGHTAIPRPRETAETPPAPWERRARELMVQPVAVAREETPLANVAKAMLEDRLGCIPIVDEHGHLAGIVTESDFLGSDPRIPLSAYQVVRLFREPDSDEVIEQVYQAGRELTAGQIMSHPVLAVTEDEPVGSVAEVLLERGFNQVPVVHEGVPVGIIARHDLLRLLIPPGGAARRAASSSE